MSQQRTETFQVAAAVQLEINLASGTAMVLSGEEGAVTVEVRGSDAESFRIEQSGDRIVLRPREGFGQGWRSYDVTVHVPQGGELEVRGASADVNVEVALARLRVNLASGNVRARDVATDALVRTASGDVHLEAVGGRLDLTTASGDVEVGSVGGAASVRAASGDLRVGTANDDLVSNSASGDVSVGTFGGALLRCNTATGNVRVGLPPRRTVDIEASTLSGTFRNDFDRDTAEGSPGTPAVTQDVADNGKARLRLRTVSGDIWLQRA